MIQKIVAVCTILSIIATFLLVQMVSPSTSGPVGILIFFGLLYVAVLGVLSFFFYAVSRLLTVLRKRMHPQRVVVDSSMSFSHAYAYALIVALAPILLLGMKSIGYGNVYEIMLVAVFVVLGCIFVNRKIA